MKIKLLLMREVTQKKMGHSRKKVLVVGGGDEYFPLLPLNKLIKFCKSLPFVVSTVTDIGEILSSSSSE